MPASQTGFGNFFLDRNMAPAGYQIPVLGCPPPGVQPQQQQAQQLAAMAAGFPFAYSGLQGYNFIPYAHHRPVTHMSNAYDLKAASPYHPALLARAAPFYPSYRPGAPEDPARVAKVATRESTGALKAWLNEHLKNPYPTKGEKIMLAIITKMSLTQVSTWFANARRRLKKENRVSWASKSKSDEEEEEEEEEGESDVDDKSLLDEEAESQAEAEEKSEVLVDVLETTEQPKSEETPEKKDCEDAPEAPKDSKDNTVSQKPKIWSLAETATSETVRKPALDNAQMGKLWAEWASRNGLFVQTVYPTPEVL